jgi:thiamine biosynthesis lipoprotein
VHGVIELRDLAVDPSGDYRRYLQVGDPRLAPTMNVRRAEPANNTVASVTVLASSCMSVDALAMAQPMGVDALVLLHLAEGLVRWG